MINCKEIEPPNKQNIISTWFWNTRIGDKLWDIQRGIKNFIKWRKIIWEDRDFDFGYLYDAIYFKLENMQKFFDSDNTCSVDAKEYAKQIKECKDLLKRIIDETVWTENWDNKGFTKTLDELSELDKKEKELFWNNICKYIDGWWD